MSFRNLVVVGALCVGTGGCSTSSIVDEVGIADDVELYSSSPGSPVFIPNQLNSHIVEFSFDSSELPDDAAIVVEPHVRYLFANPEAKVVLRGSSSEEGTNHYNYELGLSRAEAVEGLMEEYGIGKERIIVLSVGESGTALQPSRSVVIAY